MKEREAIHPNHLPNRCTYNHALAHKVRPHMQETSLLSFLLLKALHSRYKTRGQAIREITEHIEVFYNRQRRQDRLGYLSPAVYERQFYARQVAA
jgi:transposase InsO family protein